MQSKRKENKKLRRYPQTSMIATNIASTILVQDLIRDIVRDELFKILRSGDLSSGFIILPSSNMS